MIHFISDLHLSAQTPGAARIFFDFLAGRARAAGQVYILGDLFEAWPGDDCIDDPEEPFNRGVIDALRALTASGVAVSVMHGNRDFLLGEEFCRRSGAGLVADPCLLTLPDRQFVLSHGDLLCTDDRDYQLFRAQVRDPAWRHAFLGRPLAERKAMAASLRQKSEASKREKLMQSIDVMDVNPRATDDFLRAHGYATFIHGHTHRPATHDHLVDGIHVERWVLSDWSDERGECLTWDGRSLVRQALS